MKLNANKMLLGALIASAVGGTAFAQTIPPNPAAQAASTTAASTAAQGLIVTDKATSNTAIRYADADKNDLWSSKLVGANVYNNNNEKIGDIQDLAIDSGKTLSGVVVSVGGFLGLGERYVLVEPASIALKNDNGTWKAYLNTNKDDLKNAPTFTYKSAEKKS